MCNKYYIILILLLLLGAIIVTIVFIAKNNGICEGLTKGVCPGGARCDPTIKCQCCPDGSACPGSDPTCTTKCGGGGPPATKCKYGTNTCDPNAAICQCCPGKYGGVIPCPGAPARCLKICPGKCAKSDECPNGYTCINEKCVSGTPCKPDCPSGYCGLDKAGCKTTCKCSGGLVCKNNKCVSGTCTPQCPANYCGPDRAGCGTTYNCPKGQTCKNGVCVSGPPPPTTGIKINVNNKCDEKLWITLNNRLKCGHNSDTDCGKIGYKGNRHNEPLSAKTGTVTLNVPPLLKSAQFIVKSGCNSSGENCKMGQALSPCGGPGNPCQPNYTTKVESSYTDTAVNFDTSFVDGYSLPMRVEPPSGGTGNDCGDFSCGNLLPESCPNPENLYKIPPKDKQTGKWTKPSWPSTYHDPVTKINWDLTNMDLKIYDKYESDGSNPPKPTGNVIGCLSPCEKLTAAYPWGPTFKTTDPQAQWYCCPTPPFSSPQCRSGPVKDTKYTNFIHDNCKNTYAYSYDDVVGGHACYGDNKDITVTFCP